MTSTQHTQAYGVFKPVGHVVVALPTDTDCHAAVAGLLRSGFASEDIRAYSPAQMLAQADDDLARASSLAGIGQELNLVKTHRGLAQQGFGFPVRATLWQPADRRIDSGRCVGQAGRRVERPWVGFADAFGPLKRRIY